MSADREWVSARKNYLVPVKALSKLFRGIFRDLLNRALPGWRVPDTAWHAEWVVYCKPSVQGVDAVLNYLGRYVHRVAITNSRIVGIDDGQVTFRYQKCGQSEWKTLTLAAGEFIRRFLQHVLPKGVHKVRYYGLWAPAHRRLLRQVQLLLAADEPEATPQKTQSPSGQPSSFPLEGAPCPHCGQGVLVCVGRLRPYRRAPP